MTDFNASLWWRRIRCFFGFHGRSYEDMQKLARPGKLDLMSLLYREGWRCKWCGREEWY